MHNPGRLPRPAGFPRGAANFALCAVFPREIATGVITPRNDNTCVRNDKNYYRKTKLLFTFLL